MGVLRKEEKGKEGKRDILSREYRIYKEYEKRRLSWYEALVHVAGKILIARPPKSLDEQITASVRFTGLDVTSKQVFALFILTVIAFLGLSVSLAASGILAEHIWGAVVFAAFGLLLGYYFLRYPLNLLKEMRIQASSQIILAVLYMVVSMRMSPNLENALRFAAANIEGPLAWDMRRLLWDIQMHKYYSAHQALDDYIAKWKPENEEFAEAMRLVRDSTSQLVDKARLTLDEALNVVLEGSKTRMKHYTQELRMPVMMIHMMGIVLPVLGSIMAPMVAVFMADVARPEYFILGYNIVLPVVIIWFINNTLRRRPLTFTMSISKHPAFSRSRLVPLMIALLIFGGIAIYPIYYFAFEEEGSKALLGSFAERKDIEATFPFALTMSALLIAGIAAGLGAYFLLSNYEKVRVISNINSIESEFELALFQLANRISAGTPTEVAMGKSIEDVKDLKIAGLFRKTLQNMRALGFTFEAAIFDTHYGSLKYYPSRIVKSVMHAVVDTSKKGVGYASESMFRISKYMKNVREAQEYMRELLEETVSSMAFQAYILTPLVSGLIVAMADIIIVVLGRLGVYMKSIDLARKLPGIEDPTKIFGNVDKAISPELFQLIIGTYLIQVIVILAIFTTKISYGENKPVQWYTAGKMLLIGTAVYFIITLVASSIFVTFLSKSVLGLLK